MCSRWKGEDKTAIIRENNSIRFSSLSDYAINRENKRKEKKEKKQKENLATHISIFQCRQLSYINV